MQTNAGDCALDLARRALYTQRLVPNMLRMASKPNKMHELWTKPDSGIPASRRTRAKPTLRSKSYSYLETRRSSSQILNAYSTALVNVPLRGTVTVAFLVSQTSDLDLRGLDARKSTTPLHHRLSLVSEMITARPTGALPMRWASQTRFPSPSRCRMQRAMPLW